MKNPEGELIESLARFLAREKRFYVSNFLEGDHPASLLFSPSYQNLEPSLLFLDSFIDESTSQFKGQVDPQIQYSDLRNSNGQLNYLLTNASKALLKKLELLKGSEDESGIECELELLRFVFDFAPHSPHTEYTPKHIPTYNHVVDIMANLTLQEAHYVRRELVGLLAVDQQPLYWDRAVVNLVGNAPAQELEHLANIFNKQRTRLPSMHKGSTYGGYNLPNTVFVIKDLYKEFPETYEKIALFLDDKLKEGIN